MRRIILCVGIVLVWSVPFLPAAGPDLAHRLPLKHILIEADYLPNETTQSEKAQVVEPEETNAPDNWKEGSTPQESARSEAREANAAWRESKEAGMSPEAFRVMEIPSNEVLLQHDPSLAVSPHFIVAIEAHSLAFYDKKSGRRLPQTTGIPTALGSAALFRPFMAKTLNGRPNPLNLNNFTELPPGACDLTDRKKQFGCAYEVFDLRAIYDSERGRFIFAGTSRRPRPHDNPNELMNIGGKQVTVARETTLIAVSRSEDPRDGFHEYLYTQGGDWPRIAVNDRVLTVTCYDGNVVLQLSADDLARGAKNPAIARWVNDGTGHWPFKGSVVNVTQGPPWTGYSWLIKGKTGEEFVTLYAVKGVGGRPIEVRIPIRNAGKHPLKSLHDWWTDPVLRDGKLYLASTDAMPPGMVLQNGIDVATRKEAVFGCRFYDEQWISLIHDPDPAKRAEGERIRKAGPCRVRLLGFSIEMRPNGIQGLNNVDLDIGEAAYDDPPGSIASYILPAINVTRRGAVVIVYMRTQYNRLADPSMEISPEARYSVYYPGEKTIRHSRLLHRGSGVDVHPNPNQKAIVRAGNFFGMDLAQVVVDEEDVAWMSEGYAAGPTQFQEVIGAVRP